MFVDSLWSLLFLLLALTAIVRAAEESDFVALTLPDVSSVTSIRIARSCGGSKFDIPKTMFTIRPSEANSTSSLEVKTYPANLVTASVDNEFLTFTYNQDVGPSAQEGGVLITMPYDQLSGVQAATSEEVQILPGFTKIFSLSASTSAKLTADGSTLVGEASLQVDVTTSAEMKFLSGRPITGLDVSTSANFDYQGDLTGSCNVATSGDLEMKGNLLGPATCDVTTSSDATIEGSLLENTVINVGTSADLKVTGSVWGEIEASTSSDVTVTSCTNVTLSTSADCNEKNPVDETVTVKVDPQSLTLTGTNKCSGAFARYSNLVLLPSVVVSMLMFGGW